MNAYLLMLNLFHCMYTQNDDYDDDGLRFFAVLPF